MNLLSSSYALKGRMEKHQNSKRQNCETSKCQADLKAKACVGTIRVLTTRLNGYSRLHRNRLCPVRFIGHAVYAAAPGLWRSTALSPDPGAAICHLAPRIKGTIRQEFILRHWDDLLRLAGSLKLGWVTASLFISKLQAYPRQNVLRQQEEPQTNQAMCLNLVTNAVVV
jgi:Tn3 transposase DDE domain-containing protein